jgi:hypothetical protein
VKQPSKPVLEAFERFWSAYPNRRPNPRQVALEIFDRLVRGGEDPEALVGAASRYADECRALGTANEFVVHAKTFLRQRRFEDYPAPARGTAPGPDGPRDPLADHPLAFLALFMGDGDFAAWIAPLKVELAGLTRVITAPTKFAQDRVRRDWGGPIAERLGPITWQVERKQP